MTMTDAELIKMAKQYQARKKKADKAKEAADELKKALIKELDRRGTKSLVHGGVQVTKVQRTRVEYDFDQLAAELPAKTMRRIQVRRVDKDALGSLLQRGKIPAEVVDQCSKLVLDAAYPIVSLVKEK